MEEKSRQMEELTSQLSAADDRIRQVQEFADERVRELGDMKSQCENYEQNKSKLEKEIAELKQEQISQSIQLQYKEKKLEHMEAALKEKELQSKAPAQVVVSQSKAFQSFIHFQNFNSECPSNSDSALRFRF